MLCMCTIRSHTHVKDPVAHVRVQQIMEPMSEFNKLWKHQNNPAFAKITQSLYKIIVLKLEVVWKKKTLRLTHCVIANMHVRVRAHTHTHTHTHACTLAHTYTYAHTHTNTQHVRTHPYTHTIETNHEM